MLFLLPRIRSSAARKPGVLDWAASRDGIRISGGGIRVSIKGIEDGDFYPWSAVDKIVLAGKWRELESGQRNYARNKVLLFLEPELYKLESSMERLNRRRGTAPDGGWFAYAPLTDSLFSPGKGMDFWAVGVVFVGISTTVGAVNFLVTTLKCRAPGMSISRVPVLVWSYVVFSFMVLFAVPAVTLLAGGGVRGIEDLARLADAGCDGALVATAVHDGRLSSSHVAPARRFGSARVPAGTAHDNSSPLALLTSAANAYVPFLLEGRAPAQCPKALDIAPPGCPRPGAATGRRTRSPGPGRRCGPRPARRASRSGS